MSQTSWTGALALLAWAAVSGCAADREDAMPAPAALSEDSRGAHFEPEWGPWVGIRWLDDYQTRAADLLLSEHVYRECQMVFLPSFELESAVYVVRDSDTDEALAVSKRLDPQLWGTLEGGARAEDVQILAWTAPLSTDLADRLERAWKNVLMHVRHVPLDERVLTLDGARFHAAHFERGAGYLSGQASNPPDGTEAGEFVKLARLLQRFAEEELDDSSRIALVAEMMKLADSLAGEVE